MKYIFIDSNQYRHLYSSSEGFSQDIYDLLMKLIETDHVQLLLPEQVKNEVERNRCRAWPNAEETKVLNKIDKLEKEMGNFSDKYKTYTAHKILLKELKREREILENDKKIIAKRYESPRSKSNQKIKKIFEKAVVIEETKEICSKARLRSDKGNPPYDEKIGDALIWESLLSYLGDKKKSKPKLIFVANDKNAWGDNKFDAWLSKEFKDNTKGKVLYSKKLSDIPELTKVEQDKIRKQESSEMKRNAVNDFINSESFFSAGSNANRLIPFKEILSDDDRKQIIKSSLTNHEIYQSFFTAIPINKLFEGRSGYAVKYAESVPDDVWIKFCKTFSITLKRQKDEKTHRIDPKDLPF